MHKLLETGQTSSGAAFDVRAIDSDPGTGGCRHALDWFFSTYKENTFTKYFPARIFKAFSEIRTHYIIYISTTHYLNCWFVGYNQRSSSSHYESCPDQNLNHPVSRNLHSVRALRGHWPRQGSCRGRVKFTDTRLRQVMIHASWTYFRVKLIF